MSLNKNKFKTLKMNELMNIKDKELRDKRKKEWGSIQPIEKQEFSKYIQVIKELIKTYDDLTINGHWYNDNTEKWEIMNDKEIRHTLSFDELWLWNLDFKFIVTCEYIFLLNDNEEIKIDKKIIDEQIEKKEREKWKHLIQKQNKQHQKQNKQFQNQHA